MKPRLVGINHVALQVDNLEAAVEFYTPLFQPTAVDRSEEDTAFLEIGDEFLALFERGSRDECRSCSTTKSSSRSRMTC